MSNDLLTITTKRLVLRCVERNDMFAMFQYAKLNTVGPAAGWVPHTHIEQTLAFINHSLRSQKKEEKPGVWVITLKPHDTAIGAIEIHSYKGYKGEIGFVLHPNYWNQGIITEACEAAMVYAFEHLKLHRLTYAHFLDNDASARVREKLGFKVEGIKRKGFLHEDGRILDEIVSSYTSDDYQNDQARFEKIKSTLAYQGLHKD